MKIVLAVGLAVGIAFGTAAPAAADETDYLYQLAPRLTFLSHDQLLNEGYKVCRFVGVGRPTADAIPVVVKDLQITVSATMDIISASMQHLDC